MGAPVRPGSIIDSSRGESIFATGVPKSLGEPRGGAPMVTNSNYC
jgi:hypothetical protein